MTETLYFQVDEKSHKLRLDEFLFDRIEGLSKMYLRDLMKTEKCQVNGEFKDRGFRVRTNDFVELEVDRRVERAMKPEPIPLDIVFEDDEIVVVNKPAGMLMHPTFAQKTGTLLNALSYHLNFRAPRPNIAAKFLRPGLIHRLDRQTSGLVVVAKTPRAHRILADHFKRKLIEKRYSAMVEGRVREESGKIVAPIGRFADIKLWKVKPDGKYAETLFWVKQRFSDYTLLELEPVTGRTNQLRIHCAHIGHPIIGDRWHGGREFARLCLHARRLSFRHPNGNQRMDFERQAEQFFPNEILSAGSKLGVNL